MNIQRPSGEIVGGDILTADPADNAKGVVTRPIIPISAAGELSAAEKTTVTQFSFPYDDLNPRIIRELKAGSGGTVVANSLATISTGTTTGSDVLINSVIPAKAAPGQGVEVVFNAMFDATGVSGTEVLAGQGGEEDGFFFGYDGEDFGVMVRSFGSLECQTLTITLGAGTSGGNITITLDGVATAVTVALNDTIQDVVRKIVATNFIGWDVINGGDEAFFISHLAEIKSGIFSFVDTDTTGVAGSLVEMITGAVPAQSFVAQTDWNIDKMNPAVADTPDDDNPSGQTLDISKGNVFKITYVEGFNDICFYILNKKTSQFQLVHMVEFANSNTLPSIRNPTLPLYTSVKNKTTISNVSISIESMVVFTQGRVTEKGVRNSISGEFSGDATTERVIFALRGRQTFQGALNRTEWKVLLLTLQATGSGAAKFTTFRAVVDPILNGPTSWTNVNTDTSTIDVDTSSTTRTGGNVAATFRFSGTANPDPLIFDPFDLINSPSTVLALTVETDGGTTDSSAGLIFEELQ